MRIHYEDCDSRFDAFPCNCSAMEDLEKLQKVHDRVIFYARAGSSVAKLILIEVGEKGEIEDDNTK